MTGSLSLIIDLSNDVFFHIFYRNLAKISEIEMVNIGPKHQSRGPSKIKKKLIKFIIPFTRKLL